MPHICCPVLHGVNTSFIKKILKNDYLNKFLEIIYLVCMQNYWKFDVSPSFSMQMLASKHPLSFYVYILIADTPLILLIPIYYISFIYSNLNFFIIVNRALQFMCQVKLIMAVHQWWEKTSNIIMASFHGWVQLPRCWRATTRIFTSYQ